MIGLGTLVNGAAIVAGGLTGCLFGKLLKESQQDALLKACGLSILFISIAGAMEGMLSVENGTITGGGAMFITLSLSLGTLVGEWLGIEIWIEKLGNWLKRVTGNANDRNFANGFVTASLTVCVGAMAVVGSIQDGLTGDHSLLFVKALLDFIIVAVMSSALGKGCIFSCLPVMAVEGLMTVCAKLLSPVLTDAMIGAISLVGSLLIFGVGVNLVWEKKFRVANMLPALLFAVILIRWIR